jgi:hypothetical protein
VARGLSGLDLPETLSEAEKRERVALAYQRYAKRGTVAGLEEELRLATGVHAVIEEPVQYLGVWSLAAEGSGGANSVLGLTTMLVSSEPQGAVVGRSATLDHSQSFHRKNRRAAVRCRGASLFRARVCRRKCAARAD